MRSKIRGGDDDEELAVANVDSGAAIIPTSVIAVRVYSQGWVDCGWEIPWQGDARPGGHQEPYSTVILPRQGDGQASRRCWGLWQGDARTESSKMKLIPQNPSTYLEDTKNHTVVLESPRHVAVNTNNRFL